MTDYLLKIAFVGSVLSVSFIVATVLIGTPAMAEIYAGKPYDGNDLFADTWVATDDAERTQPDITEAGPVKGDKWVGIFYWTWHVPRTGGPNDNTKIIAAAGDATEIAWPNNGAPHHWGEPELGYYRMTDPFVIRKHASMLADAGVDAVFFDTTNPPHTWKEEYEALCREYEAMRNEGARTPYIVFITPFWDPTEVVNRLWPDLYKPGLWQDLWFRWDGKPLLLANPEFIKDPEVLNFFTLRRPMPDYWLGPDGPDQWSWLEVHPQHVFLNSKGEAEQMSVGVAQNALPDTPGPAPMSDRRGAMGRSWHGGAKDTRDGAVNLGLNFEEQWRRALEVNPKFIFVTGWNEWVAGRYTEWSKYTDETSYYRGGLFVDQYTHEYSRDCEPMRGGHTDNYYYQLASWIRKFKGVRPRPEAAGPSTINVDGNFDDWASVVPEYRDTIGDVTHRNHLGYGEIPYTNATGRNDFVIAKAAYDTDHLFFFIQTRDPITPCTDPYWMLLLVDSDQDTRTGWLGYDFILNLDVEGKSASKGSVPDGGGCRGCLNMLPCASRTTVKRWQDGGWQSIGHGQYRVNGNGMELVVSRALLRQEQDTPSFDFHWADNIQGFSDVSELGVNGDSAPNRRWNYRYTVAP
ncbi:MAG: hypothetical protein GXY07_20090 [Candidatus Hydrogenedentes bacterium]|nr:hypothetical protein [Candidatus Hydrogenedentota bacterium]